MNNYTFLNHEKALLTVMLQCHDPETAIGRIRNANFSGAEAYGLQVESMRQEFHTPEVYQRLFKEMKRPVYVTNYRSRFNEGKTDEQLAEGLLTLAENGATLCDMMGDYFDRQPDELATDPTAVQKQMELIEQLHARGAEVLMSSHVLKFTPAERVLEIALEQQRRGADVVKIVTAADTPEQEIENLRINLLLKEKLSVPYLYLSGGSCNTIHRRLGWKLGCGMILCVYEHDAFSTAAQPLLSTARAVRDEMNF